MIFATKLLLGGDRISGGSGASKIVAMNSCRIVLVEPGMSHDGGGGNNPDFLLLYGTTEDLLKSEFWSTCVSTSSN
jgi:hypothetical protein